MAGVKQGRWPEAAALDWPLAVWLSGWLAGSAGVSEKDFTRHLVMCYDWAWALADPRPHPHGE